MADSRPVPPALAPFWQSSVERFATLDPLDIEDAQKERHRLYSLLLSALIYDKWNGNKHGEVGDYGDWRRDQVLGPVAPDQKIYCGGSYLGHNIAALAVDGDGRIMDFDFNHNDVFDSSVEHAESRLVRRLFALSQIYDPWAALAADVSSAERGQALADDGPSGDRTRTVFETAPADSTPPADRGTMLAAGIGDRGPGGYSTRLQDVTIYTSLESCAQCSGIMCLANVKEIVYLQWDQGQYLVGNMMWRATRDQKESQYGAPRPIRGDDFGFEYFTMLNNAYEAFRNELQSGGFFFRSRASDPGIARPSITAFLCTDMARDIFGKATVEMDRLVSADLTSPEWRPGGQPTALTNGQVLTQVKDFLVWTKSLEKVSMLSSRGAPHRV